MVVRKNVCARSKSDDIVKALLQQWVIVLRKSIAFGEK